jgi:tetratricopeptide (TPR) repeat protein
MTSASEQLSFSTERGAVRERPRRSLGRRPAPFRLARLLAAFLAAVALPAATSMAQVEEEDIAASVAGYRSQLADADGLLGELEFAAAIDAYTRLVEAYRSGQIPMMTPDAREIVAKSWEGRAIALANLGRSEEAKADFDELIRFDPTHTIALEDLSAKIVALFTESRKALVGVLQVETLPLGAEVTLDGQSIGPTPVMDRQVLAGAHRMRVEREGFDAVDEEITIVAGSRLERQISLVPNARGIRVATIPREVKVVVDGVERGATFGRADATYEEAAAELGVALSEVSEPLLVPNLAPGDHTMILRRECYEEVTVKLSVTVDPENNEPSAFKPFLLRPSRGSLEIASSPPGAQVTLDGSVKGAAPLLLRDLCSGRHELRMESEGQGRYTGAVEVRKEQTVKVSERLRLSLAVFDLRAGREPGKDLAAALSGIERYNVIHEGNGVPPELAQRVRLEVEASKAQRLGGQSLGEIMKALNVELLALGVGAGALGERTEFQLYGPHHDEPDRWLLEGSGLESFRRVSAALDRELEVSVPWSGIKLIDVRGESSPFILAITPGSPADTAGITPGDFLTRAGVSPIASSADFDAAMMKASPGDEVALSLSGTGGIREVKVVLRSTPVLLPRRDESILFNKAIVDLRQEAARAGEERTAAGYAWLNVGMALMHFGRFEEAIREGFRKAELPDAAGISLGTARYLMGICYEKLGLHQEARSAYQQAAASATSTVGSHDGPTIAASARRRISVLAGS